MVKFGFAEAKKSATSSSAAAATKNTTMSSTAAKPAKTKENIYENQAADQGGAAEEADHTYSTAEYANIDKSGKHEFPAKSDDNANI